MARAKFVTGERLPTPIGRLSFPAFVKPESYQEGKPKFQATLIFEEKAVESELFAALKKEAARVATEAFGSNAPNMNLHNPFRKGEEKPDLEGYEPGSIFIRAKSDRRPELLDAAGKPLDVDDIETVLYAGCYVRAFVVPFAYFEPNKGISFGLRSVKKVADGEAFGGGGSCADLYDDLGDEGLPEGAAAPALADDDELFG